MPEPQRQPKKDVTRGVVAVEEVARKVVVKSIDSVARYAGATSLSPHLAASLIQGTTALAITKAREASAQRAALSFERQTGLDVDTDEAGAEDAERAQSAAHGIAKAFRENVATGLTEGLTTAAAYTAAAKAMRSNVERTVTTEVMHAWNGEARRLAKASRVDVTQRWNAELDACDECAGLDGMTIAAQDTFPYGDPPLHPHCRCAVESRVAAGVIEEDRASETRVRAAQPGVPPTTAAPAVPQTFRTKAAALDHAVSEANRIGVANGVYNEEGMRPLTLHRGAFTGATPAEVEKIATGLAPAMNTSKVLPPIKVVLDSGDLVVTDGRHRMTAAAEAGAEHVHAIVSTYHRGKKVEREAIVRLGGMTRVQPTTDALH